MIIATVLLIGIIMEITNWFDLDKNHGKNATPLYIDDKNNLMKNKNHKPTKKRINTVAVKINLANDIPSDFFINQAKYRKGDIS